MKKALPYILGGLMLVLLLVMMASSDTSPVRRMDERVTLRHRDKIPYGTSAAYELLPSLFPSAHVTTDNTAPGGWDSIAATGSAQAVIFIADYFDAETEALEELASFVEQGNYVFIITRAASDDVGTFFGARINNYATHFGAKKSDSLHMRLEAPAFINSKDFTYPGIKQEGTLSTNDSGRSLVLGRNEYAQPNFLRFDKERGSIFLHSAPLAFSNYFILHKGNAAYFEQAMSVLPKDLESIVWDEYYLQNHDNKKDANWLRALLSYPAFKWGLLVGAITLALYVLLGMRRRQRMIPPHEGPKNDSLDFVKTLGRLYYDRRDHRNLADKMATYFLEHVRSQFKLATHTLDEDFVRALHYKSGYPEADTKKLIQTIQYIQTVPSIPETELAAFHRQLEAFYQNT